MDNDENSSAEQIDDADQFSLEHRSLGPNPVFHAPVIDETDSGGIEGSMVLPFGDPTLPVIFGLKPAAAQRQSNSRAYRCEHPGCDQGFYRREHLIRHERIHTGEKPFRCNIPTCCKRFSRLDELKRHVKTHQRHKSTNGSDPRPAQLTFINTVIAVPPAVAPIPSHQPQQSAYPNPQYHQRSRQIISAQQQIEAWQLVQTATVELATEDRRSPRRKHNPLDIRNLLNN